MNNVFRVQLINRNDQDNSKRNDEIGTQKSKENEPSNNSDQNAARKRVYLKNNFDVSVWFISIVLLGPLTT